jgi:hypothetical protein
MQQLSYRLAPSFRFLVGTSFSPVEGSRSSEARLRTRLHNQSDRDRFFPGMFECGDAMQGDAIARLQ